MASRGLNLEIGDEFQGGDVVAIHQQENHGDAGVVLTFHPEECYVVSVVDAFLKEIRREAFVFNTEGLARYVELVAQQMYHRINRPAPGLSYMIQNNT